MNRKLLSNFRSRLVPVAVLRVITCVFSLFYLISCGSDKGISSPSSSLSLDPVKLLILEGVTEKSITVSWELLKLEGVADPDPTIVYTIYVKTTNEKGEFPNDDSSFETAYPLINLEGSPAEFEITNLANDTPYRIVVEAKDDSGATSRSRLLAYTASEWGSDDVVSDVEVATVPDQEEVTVTWSANSKAQGYAIKIVVDENQFGGEVIGDDIIAIVCLPDSPLCKGDGFAEKGEGGKLKHKVKVDRTGVRYSLVVVPFNFKDLKGLRAVDKEGLVRTFIEEVLVQTEVETSALYKRLGAAPVKKITVEVDQAGAPVDLELSSTGSTVKAIWGHGTGAQYYYAFISSDGGENAVTNFIDRFESDGRYTGGGFTSFSGLTAETSYTVTVQSLTVVSRSTNVGGQVSGTISTTDAEEVLDVPKKVMGDNLTLTNEGVEKLRIIWNTTEANSVIGYNVFYWTGDIPPAKPQYVAVKGETNIILTVDPNIYNVRVDVFSTYPDQDLVTGEIAGPILIYGKPSAPTDLGVFFSRGSFVEIGNKLYAVRYPLGYTGAGTIVEAGGSLTNLFYHYRYRVSGGEWKSYVEIINEAVIDLMVDDLGDVDKIKAGYGKKYEVELVASNGGGFVSKPATLTFDYRSFPEPFAQGNNLVVTPGDRSLTVAWLEVTEKNGSTVASYTVVLSTNAYTLPVESTNTVERKVVFEGLENNRPYIITVIPNGRVTGNILGALARVTSYTLGAPIEQGSEEERILGTYIGAPEWHTPQGAPEAVVNLDVTAGRNNQATVVWEAPIFGSLATKYELQYLKNITELITNLDVIGENVDAELSKISWEGATPVEVLINSTGDYSEVVSGLNVTSATNVFRVRAVRIDDSKKEWPGEYRYYALGVNPSQPPGEVVDLVFSGHQPNLFEVSWSKPTNTGRNENKEDALLAGYRVSWGITEKLEESFEINNPDTLSYSITGLTPGTRYYVKVQAKNGNEEGRNYNVGIIGTTYTIKAPVSVDTSTISYSEHTTNSFKVSWNAVTDAGYGPKGKLFSVGYFLEWSSDQGANWEMVTRSNSYTATKETLTGLTSGTKYRVRITTTNGFSSAASEGGDTSTLSLPGQVEDMVVSNPTYDGNASTGTGGFTVSWTAPKDTGFTADGTDATVTGYEVAYAEMVGEALGGYTTAEVNKLEYVFTGLKPNTQYDIRIRARTAAGAGIGSHVSGWVPSLPAAVAPSSITFPRFKSTIIDIAWVAPQPGRAGGDSSDSTDTLYKVEISSDGKPYTVVATNHASTNITVTNLTKSTPYTARITAWNVWGEADPVTSASLTTRENDFSAPSQVRNLKWSSQTRDSVTFSWEAPTDAGADGDIKATISGYLVKYKEFDTENEFNNIDENSVGVRLSGSLTSGTSTSTTVEGLKVDTKYTFLVVASNSAGRVGLDSEAPKATWRTDKAHTPPTNLRLNSTCREDKEVKIAWTPPDSRVTYYKVKRILDNTLTTSGNIATNFYTDTDLKEDTQYGYTVEACSEAGCSDPSEQYNTATLKTHRFKHIVETIKEVPSNLSDYDRKSQEIFSRYPKGTRLIIKNAANNLKSEIDGSTDPNVVYVILMEKGDFTSGSSISMKNNVAIVGGVDDCTEPGITTTTLKGGSSYEVFKNKALNHTALLYGVTITKGKGSSQYGGGGMFNDNASPSLIDVTFLENNSEYGGGMYNSYSSPTLYRVTFSGNTADLSGGGMYNYSSSPSLVGVTFSGNSAKKGGGMYNFQSSPILYGTTFTKNGDNTGATYDYSGGGMYNDNNGQVPYIFNSIFWGNKAAHGSEIFISAGSIGDGNNESMYIYNSIIQGVRQLSPGYYEGSINQGGLVSANNNNNGGEIYVSVKVTHANLNNSDPKLKEVLANNGGLVQTHAIESTSPAVNQGLYVRKKGTTFYYSKDNTDWYAKPDLSGTATTLPDDTEDLTATDATGYKRTNRPDLGAYEYR